MAATLPKLAERMQKCGASRPLIQVDAVLVQTPEARSGHAERHETPAAGWANSGFDSRDGSQFVTHSQS